MEYVALAMDYFTQDKSPIFRLQKPFGYNRAVASLKNQEEVTERGWTHPVRVAEECGMCYNCETGCPTQAFDADTGLSDPQKCIKCMHCVYMCPTEAIKIDERMKDVYADFLEDWHLTETIMKDKKSKIITKALQAAF